MKKFIKWFLFCLVVCGGLALAICYMVIPQQTKSAIDIVIGYLNTPLGIIGGSTITLGLVAGIILKVVYDRYKDSVRNDFAQAKSYAETQKEQAKGYYELAVQEREQIRDILTSYDKRIDSLLDNICKVCETVPNAKVQALAITIKKDGTKLKEELKESLEEQSNLLANSIGAKSRIEKLEDQIDRLTKELERLEQLNEKDQKGTNNKAED